jgi:hypothetical protein
LCTTETTPDGPALGHGFFCVLETFADKRCRKFRGHINWRPATYEGTLGWAGKSKAEPFGDNDYTLSLSYPEMGALTVYSQDQMHIEFDNAEETIDHFGSPWWRDLHDAAEKGDDIAVRKKLVDREGNGLFATVIGLLGLDAEHKGHSELHPVYGMAVRVDRTAAGSSFEETWAIFARNWGNEGWCSLCQHNLEGLPQGSMTLRLPIPSGASLEEHSEKMFTNHPGVRGPFVAPAPDGSAVIVRFGLPPAEQRARVSGELRLRWKGGSHMPEAAAKLVPAAHGERAPTALSRTGNAELLLGVLESHSRRDEALRKHAASLAKPEPVIDSLEPSPDPGLASVEPAPQPPHARAVCDPVVPETHTKQLALFCQTARSLEASGTLRNQDASVRKLHAELMKECAITAR